MPRTSRRRLVLIVGVVVAALVAASCLAWWWYPRWLAGEAPLPPKVTIAAGKSHTCAITSSGGVKCWGDNHFGQLGNGSTVSSVVPVQVVGLETGVISLTGSGQSTCALTSTGKVKCWGANESGQLGDGSTQQSATPRDVTTIGAEVIQVTLGGTHACAVTNSRALWCWGSNGTGELGTGDNAPSPAPVAVKSLPTRVAAVDAGNGFTCALLVNSTVSCWGDNGDGQLGTGDTTGRTTGQTVGDLDPVTRIAVGDAHACVLSKHGTVACWGANWGGQLGVTMASVSSAFPIAVPGIPADGSLLAAGYNRSCLAAAGRLTCWGGALDAAGAEKADPRAVSGLTGVTEVSVGDFHVCSATEGQVLCWGDNSQGQLGDGTTRNSESAVRVIEL